MVDFTSEDLDNNKQENKQNVKRRGMVVLLYGDTGLGKTYVSLSFPEPIYIVDTENRAINTVNALFKNKDINICEPLELKTKVSRSMDDLFDEVASINNVTAFLSDYVNKIQSGEIVGGTLIIDSCSDIWTWCQSYMFDKLSKISTKNGQARADDDMRTVLTQTDWKIATSKHESIIRVLRSLVKNGINVVFTAREKSVPEYITTPLLNKDKIRCQKDLPFASDVIINLKKQNGKYLAVFEKLGTKEVNNLVIEKVNYEKILELNPLGEQL